ncbi:MAG TPA: hypothetical protein VFU26_06655 [Gaiellaceae bacterium]|nr:hypothetical protein [Gaiellaceae bacterium]
MRWIVTRAVKVGLAVSVAIGITAIASPGLGSVLVDAYLVALGGVLLLALLRATIVLAPWQEGSEFERTLAGMRRRRPEVTELGFARDLESSTLNDFHLHRRLRPVLQEIAAHRLLTRYGVDLAAEPARARELVGPTAWELVRPERPSPENRRAPGPSLSHLRRVVAELERI